MRKILKLEFLKTDGHVDLNNADNLDKIHKYILPIIAQNEGWDSAELTVEAFNADPIKFQNEMDVTLFDNVQILFDENENPAALIEYQEESFGVGLNKERMDNLVEMVNDKDSQKWQYLIEKEIVPEVLLNKEFANLYSYFVTHKIYSELGIVVRPDLQGKGSGLAEEAYSVMKSGVIFAWTNTPIVVRQFRKTFESVLYFPVFDEIPRDGSLFQLACIALLYSDLLTYIPDRWQDKEFGALYSEYFVSKRGHEYLELARKMAEAGKIEQFDAKRIEYLIGQQSTQGAIFAETKPQS